MDSGEKLLWSGQPRQGLRLNISDVFVIPFSLLWCGFAIFWEANAVKGHSPFVLKLWGIPFVVIGLYMVFGRFFMDARTRVRT
ncbi:MAG TPA: PH domain-containing protein, partial [Verrucomicrobiae bacterium]|nr:PH domain-containing protein [Verrucomicrobiae bacterium]